ncbi:MAG: RNA methyltransferase [Firmicutes bacterium]|nr:RNA methyltransferase [Bacillota bacterium]
MSRLEASIYLGLIHYPIYNKRGAEITTTITNMDLHDIARAGKTYSIEKYYVVNPLKSQQSLVRRMKKYWESDYGAEYNSNRQEAFSILDIAGSMENVIEDIFRETGSPPILVATDANPFANSVSYSQMREIVFAADRPILIIFGTGWGLTEKTLQECDYILEPVYGRGNFNHLSVRSAVSIILDRLLAEEWWV